MVVRCEKSEKSELMWVMKPSVEVELKWPFCMCIVFWGGVVCWRLDKEKIKEVATG